MARQATIDERGSVHGVNSGMGLGRYTVGTRIEAIPGGERWTARDTTLERDVALLVMPAGDASTDGALDAARRAAGIEAPQLVRILDVGSCFFLEGGAVAGTGGAAGIRENGCHTAPGCASLHRGTWGVRQDAACAIRTA